MKFKKRILRGEAGRAGGKKVLEEFTVL